MQVFRLFLFLCKTLTSKLLKPNISGAQQLLASSKLSEHKLEIHNLHAKIQ